MNRFIPREKLSRKARRQLDNQRRTVWVISPVTRKPVSKKTYSRKKVSRSHQDEAGYFSFWTHSAHYSPQK